MSLSVVSFGERLGPIFFLYRTSILINFISENGIVAVLGDENQFVKVDVRRISRPLSFERGHMDQIWGNDSYCREVAFSGGIDLKFRPLFRSQSPKDKLVDALIL